MKRPFPIPVLTGTLLLVLAVGSGAFAPRARRADAVDVPLVAAVAAGAMRPLFEPPPAPPDVALGRFKLTYYYMPQETEQRAQSVQLYTRSCRKIARVSRAFS